MANPKRRGRALLAVVCAVTAAYAGFVAFMITIPGGWWAVALVPLLMLLLWLNQVLYSAGKKLAPRTFRAAMIGLTVLLALSFSVPLLVEPRWKPAIAYDATDPQRAGCADVGETLNSAQWPIIDAETGDPLATALLKYSTACDTTWVKLEGITPGTRTIAQVTRPAGDWLLPASPEPERDAPSEGIAYSKQLRFNGCTYVNVTLLNSGGDVIAQLEESSGCEE
ncbi:YjfA family protein [Microbacterium sp. EST19A]|uniref:YjfA family protein n=1 Tax=Microbacterium sp. EST19A TaxID=2862681 RepID=UPI001CBD79F9|nr:YjfA family protein [Microbacterium sp. EST19A]